MAANMTLAESTAEEIQNMIRTEQYAPGMRLPTEAELCRRFSASRNTIREAIRLLASRNIVSARQGSGIFVSENPGVSDDPLGFSMITDRRKLTEDLFQLLIILEPSIAGLAAEHASEEDFAVLDALVSRLEVPGITRDDYRTLDAKFHCALAESTHNLAMRNLTPVIESGILFYSGEFDSSAYGAHFHRTLLKYIRERKSTEAESEMRYHLLFDKHHYRQKNDSSDAAAR